MNKKEPKFLMVSLEDKESKKLAQIISNNTSRKILELLAEKDASETELSKKLNQPISTIHYNIKQLMEAKLIECKEFHYSQKGKEVNHYSLANKCIIIAPKIESETIKEKLKSFIPALLIVGITGYLYNLFSKKIWTSKIVSASLNTKREAQRAILDESIENTMKYTNPTNNNIIHQIQEPNYFIYILIGSITTIILYLFIDYLRKRINKNRKR